MQTTVNATEAARRLNVSDKTIRAWVKQGKLPAKRHANGQYAIQVHDLHVAALTDVLQEAVLNDNDFCDVVTSYPTNDNNACEAAVKNVIEKLQSLIWSLQEIGVIFWSEKESNSAR